MLATLVLAGVRLGEMLALRWRDVDLANERLWIADAKTDAGVRHVALFPALREILITHKLDCADTRPDALVFATNAGKRLSGDNVRDRTFAAAVRLADETRVAAGLAPLPEGLTPHKLRHTCCSLLFVCGYELPRAMSMLGHADSSTTLRIYAHVMSAEEGDRDRLRGLVAGADWAPMGTTPSAAASETVHASRSGTKKAPR
jgi:integrase